jgi:hypothetical protein
METQKAFAMPVPFGQMLWLKPALAKMPLTSQLVAHVKFRHELALHHIN